MWQRKQTIYLVLALVAICFCLYLPVLGFTPMAMAPETLLYNLGSLGVEVVNKPWILFIFLALAFILNLVAIFMFKNRKLQMKLITWAAIACVGWYAYLLVCLDWSKISQYSVKLGVCLPLVAMVLNYMAFRGVKADEKLVISMDRSR